MSLKDQIAADIDAIFLNTDDFADKVTLNGITLKCVIDDDRLLNRTDLQAKGVYLGERLIFVKASDLPGKPAVGARIELNGKPWFVSNVTENMGMYEIRIGANKT